MDRVQKAEILFTGGCNCAQAVFAAFADELGMDEELAKKIATGLGGGVGRMREVCGAVSAAALVIGMRLGPDKMKAYPVIQDFCAKFKEKCGSIVCRELLGLTQKRDDPTPAARTLEYYQDRPCKALVGLAAETLNDFLLEQETE